MAILDDDDQDKLKPLKVGLLAGSAKNVAQELNLE